MKIKLSYPDLPPLEIEAEPDECARLLRALSVTQDTAQSTSQAGSSPAPVAQKVAVADDPSIAAPVKRTAVDKTPITKAPKPAAPSPTEKGDSGNGVRRYGGRTNRRFLILECLRVLRERGVAEPTMPQITETFETRYPEVNRDNLEQVVRDLVNKTDKVTRLRWGVFQLTDESPSR